MMILCVVFGLTMMKMLPCRFDDDGVLRGFRCNDEDDVLVGLMMMLCVVVNAMSSPQTISSHTSNHWWILFSGGNTKWEQILFSKINIIE